MKKVKAAFRGIVIFLLCVIEIYPLFWMLTASFKKQAEWSEKPAYALNDGFYFQNYSDAWTRGHMSTFFKNSLITTLVALVFIVFFSTFLNLFMTSGSSKWMILAPILIPMLYAIGFSPALTTVAYRIGDSATNAIAPISSDVALIVGLLGKYNTDKSKTPGMGTVFAGCMPYAIATMITELLILGVWWAINLPLGPGVTMFIK